MSILLSVDPHRPDEGVMHEAARLLTEGAVVAYPTDTFYGLAVEPRSSSAVTRLFDVKGRDAARAIPLIAADLGQVLWLCGALPPLAARLADAFWPGPLTLVLPLVATLAPELAAGGATVAVRVPDHAVSRALARALGVPITSTSANVSGAPPTTDAATVGATLPGVAILDAGPAPGGLASTIVDVTSAEPRLLRAGAVAWERVLQFRSK